MPIERDQAASVLDALVSLVRVTRTIAHRDSAHSVTATPIALLRLVSETDPRLGDLAEQLRVKPSVASRAVAALDAEGYVSRDPDPADARACRIRITETGREYLKSREDWALDMVARTLSDWSPEDADQSIRVLQRLEHSVDEWVGHFERAAAAGAMPLATVTADPPDHDHDGHDQHDQPNHDQHDHDQQDHLNEPTEANGSQPMTSWETTAV